MAILPTRRLHAARRSLRTFTVLAALAGTVIVAPGLASGAPTAAPRTAPHATPHTPTISEVEKQLGELALTNSQVVEKYNQARIVLARTQKAADVAAASARVADASYRRASVQFTQLVQAQYESGSMGEAGVLFDSASGNNYVDQLNTLDMISAHDAMVVASVTKQKNAAVAASAKAGAMLAAAKAQSTALAAQRAGVQKQISTYQTLLATLTIKQQAAFSRSVNPSVSVKALEVLQKNIPGGGSAAAQRAVRYALNQVGKPYVFGAAGPGAFDCSGLTMAAWQRGGVSLPHSAADQYNYGHHVAIDKLTPGDLIFMYSPIGHVTIYAGNGMMVSAPTEGEPVTVVSVQSFASDIVGATHLG